MELKPPAALYDKGGNNYEFLWEAKESQRSPSKLLPHEPLISKPRRCRAALRRWGKQNEQDARADDSAIDWHSIWKDWKLRLQQLLPRNVWTVKTEHGSGFMFQVRMILCNFTSNHLARDITTKHTAPRAHAWSSDRWPYRERMLSYAGCSI